MAVALGRAEDGGVEQEALRLLLDVGRVEDASAAEAVAVGRPKKLTEVDTRMVAWRARAAEREAWQAAADRAGVPLPVYARGVLNVHATSGAEAVGRCLCWEVRPGAECARCRVVKEGGENWLRSRLEAAETKGVT